MVGDDVCTVYLARSASCFNQKAITRFITKYLSRQAEALHASYSLSDNLSPAVKTRCPDASFIQSLAPGILDGARKAKKTTDIEVPYFISTTFHMIYSLKCWSDTHTEFDIKCHAEPYTPQRFQKRKN